MGDTETANENTALVAAADPPGAVNPGPADGTNAAAETDPDTAEQVDDLAQVKALLGDGSELAFELATATVQILGAAGHQVAAFSDHLVASVKHLLAPFEARQDA